MKKISVIIPTFNEAKVIKDCVASLKNQKNKEVEIIIVDDGSTDNTKEILKSMRVNVYEQNHLGPATARNLGAKHAKGEVLVFVDADMTFDKNFIDKLTRPIFLGKTKGTFSKEEFVSNWNDIWSRCWNINENLPVRRRLPLDYPDHQKVFRAILKSEFEKVNGFAKGGYTDDYTLSEKLGYEATSAKGAIFYHRNPDNLKEIFLQAKWIAKRKYKYGIWGTLFALFRSSLPMSIILSLLKISTKLKSQYGLTELLLFPIFKITYDLGIFVGIIEMLLFKKLSK